MSPLFTLHPIVFSICPFWATKITELSNYFLHMSILRTDDNPGIFQLFFSTVHFDYVGELWNYPIIFSICPFWGQITVMEFSNYLFNCPFWLCIRIMELSNHFSICPFWGRIGSQCLSAIEPTIATALHNIEAQILPRSIINKHSLFGVVFTTRDINSNLWQSSRQSQPSSTSNH